MSISTHAAAKTERTFTLKGSRFRTLSEYISDMLHPLSRQFAEVILLASLFFWAGCASPGNPSHFMEKGLQARQDTERHLRVIDQLCALPETEDTEKHPYCIEAIRLREITGQKEEATTRAMALCQKKDPEACLIWARLAASQDQRLARETLSRSCDENAAWCVQSARLELQAGNLNEAIKKARRGCAAGYPTACKDQGLLAVELGDLTSASVALEKACEANVDQACFEKFLVIRMKGKPVDDQMDQLCKAGDSPLACDVQEVDIIKALNPGWWTMADRTCRKEETEICYRVALDQYFRPGGKSLAQFRFKKDCEAHPEHAASCFMSLRIQRPLGFLSEDEGALRQLCEKSIPAACHEIQSVAAEPTVRVSRVADENLSSSCEQDQRPESCESEARRVFRSGDTPKAEKYMTIACELKSEDACAWMGMRRLDQKPVDPKGARDFFRKACLSGSVLGCEKLLTLASSPKS